MKKISGKWVVEPHRNTLLGYKMKKKLYDKRSRFQRIEIFETESHGNMMLLDDCFMLNEYEEFAYHEMIAHVPLYSHPGPERVIVIGGGDGGTVREVLKHKSVKEVDFVEIDRKVYEVSRRYFRKLTSWHGDSRVNFRFVDGAKFIREKHNYYDVAIIDSTDPVDIGKVLFSAAFYSGVKKALKKNGVVAAQTEDPYYSGDLLRNANKRIKKVFGRAKTAVYTAFIPTYPSGCWTFNLASKTALPGKIKNKQPVISGLKYYNKKVHRACFCLPEFVEKKVK